MTNHDGGALPRTPTTVSVPNYGEESGVTGSQSATDTASEVPAIAPQQHGGDPQLTTGGSNSSSTNEHGQQRFHQGSKLPYLASNIQNDRDLEMGEPSAPITPVSPVTAGQNQGDEHRTTGVTSSKVTRPSDDLVHFLKSALSDRKYRECAMGYGDTVHNSFLVKRIIGKIATWSSNRLTWRPLRYLATVLQHLVSRWVHSGYRKHFETLHPHLYDGTAVHLLQNIGGPSSRWIDEILKQSLGLDPLFLLEHIVLTCDGSRAGLVSSSTNSKRLQCTSAWHVRAILSDQPMLQFCSWSATEPLEKARLACISFQQTSQGSCESDITL